MGKRKLTPEEKAKRAKVRKEFERVARETRAVLVERFPAVFMGKGVDKIPLKVGIDKEIRAAIPELKSRQVYCAMRDYVTGGRYLKAMVAGAVRIGLDGNPSGTVTEEQAQIAAARLKALNGRITKREAARAARTAGVSAPETRHSSENPAAPL